MFIEELYALFNTLLSDAKCHFPIQKDFRENKSIDNQMVENLIIAKTTCLELLYLYAKLLNFC